MSQRGALGHPDALHAWVDESMRVEDDGTGAYILAAVVCRLGDCDTVRQTLRRLLRGRAPRLHWRDEDDRRRTAIASTIGGLSTASVVVVGRPMSVKKQERARRICLESLLPALADRGVDEVWLESRTVSLNSRDRAQVANLVGRRLITADVRVHVARPIAEPMLWVPDAVAGAVNAALSGNPVWFDLLSSSGTRLDIPLR